MKIATSLTSFFACAVLSGVTSLWPAQPAQAQFTQQARLFGSAAIGNAQQGGAVALSRDGSTAIAGGPIDNGGAGAAWVFTRTGNAWTQQAKLVGSGAIGQAFQGTRVALSSDGNTAIVSGPIDNASTGAAWVFTRSGGTWSQQAKLVGSGAIGVARQGFSVALSADGNTAAVGGAFDNGGAGAAWVFTRSGAAWSEQAKLVGSGAIGKAQQGGSVALSGDGNTLVMGGGTDNSNTGAAWVFTRTGGTLWGQQAKLVGIGAVGGAQQGASVALSGDGDTAAVGGSSDNTNVGAVWVFTRSAGIWSQQGNKLVGTGVVGIAQQGFSIALSGDGNAVLIGGPSDGPIGAAWVFLRNAGTWSQQGNKLTGTGSVGDPTQGTSVALSCNTALVGGPFDNSDAGATWVFAAPPHATHDVNGDCRSDIVWWNATSGQVVTWEMNGASVIDGGSPGSMAAPWAIVGQRDFNGDGFADLLWRNGTTGQTMIWLLNGASIIGSGLPGTVTADWTVAGTGDFNGDGMGDILWYNMTSGQLVLWFLNGTSVIGGGSPGSVPSPWTIAGTGDFDGDSFTDILWYSTSTGQALIWFMNGISVVTAASPGSAASPWMVAGTGDFNGNGQSDIVWYNTTNGQTVIWLLNGASVITGGSPGMAASPWTIAQTGDFDGDGKSDILWMNTATGQAVLWFLNGTSLIGGGSPGSAMSPWQVQGLNSD